MSRQPGRPTPKRWGWLRLLAITLCLATGQRAQAADFFISDIRTEVKDGVYVLDADIDYRFSDEALRALSNGVPLTVQLSLEIERLRKWWLNEKIATLEQRYSLQYHALTHQYLLRNLNSGAFYSLPHYPAAIEALGTLRDLPLLDKKLVLPEEHYQVAIRVELDIEALPSPLRPVAYITPDWHLRSDWHTWSLTP
ncbi:MAG: DUF4390 domain-containing protein [Gammaproteobacteria bacterium]|nr:DUF4390 domain-containing protein [Gammaproteobacteria bacterium]